MQSNDSFHRLGKIKVIPSTIISNCDNRFSLLITCYSETQLESDMTTILELDRIKVFCSIEMKGALCIY